ncbi:DUF1289 domain-containing protein [Undibacterium sp. SXout7W]|uniref:DUF1289 domain-containing protein n=1 Tax=Undibacterium sp. SXout7W TaxID=3413049 RepID=UPI003BF2D891
MTILYEFNPDDYVEQQGETVPSPCINICRMDEQKRFCLGCFRSIDEIICWSKADNATKLTIWREVQQRMLD